uniref:Glycerophosphoryl diester phosphodiesterase membrane domain-containing protein n=1 Tax=Panagrolaimus sp. PS1159 TaxID=55785 RepID=A0AC35F020_9BILA
MLPPSIEYWLNGIKILKKVSTGLFVIFLLPEFLLLRLSRVDRELIEKEVLTEGTLLTTSTMLDQSQPLIIIYSGKLNFYFYVFLGWAATSLFVLLIFFILFHINIYNAMNETKVRYLEETYRGQKLVFTVFSIQMASFVLFFILPISVAALSAINLFSIPHFGYELLIISITFHTVLDSICVLYFIKAYRHFTFTLLQYLYKVLRYKNYSKEFPWETSLKVLG